MKQQIIISKMLPFNDEYYFSDKEYVSRRIHYLKKTDFLSLLAWNLFIIVS